MMESGLVAAVTSATFAVVSGGAGCLAVAAWIAARMPDLRRYRVEPVLAGAEHAGEAAAAVVVAPAGRTAGEPGTGRRPL
jgi:hypothetical protein